MGEIIYEKHFHKETIEEIEKDRINFVEAIGEDAEQAPSFDEWIFLCGSTAVPEERIPPIQRQETAVPEQRYRT